MSVNSKRRSLQLQPLHLLTASSPPPSPAPRRQSSISIPYRPERSVHREPVTLADKHADLLHFIAQKESKCLELRSQLAVHEAELLELKRKWERIVSRGFERQQTQPPPPTPTSAPVASSSSSAPATPPPSASIPLPIPILPTSLNLMPASPLPGAPGFDDISSWITTNIPKKWDTAGISKRASMFGQSIAQALDGGAMGYNPSPKPLTTPSTTLGRTASLGRRAGTGPLRASKLTTSHSPSTSTSTLSDAPSTSPSTSSASNRLSTSSSSSGSGSPTMSLAALNLSNPPMTPTTPTTPTSKQPASRRVMSLTRTPEVDEVDESWNW